MKSKIKVGIIGCGSIGSVHAEHYGKINDVELAALCDVLPEKLGELAGRHKVLKTFLDYHRLLADPEIDAVSVCVPNDLHAPIAIDALKAGKHVMLEKPMTLNAELAHEILKARDAAGKVLQLGMVRRQLPESQIIKEMVGNGRLGSIYHIRVKTIRRRGIPGLGSWFTTKARSGGGGLIDIAVHSLDQAMWLAGCWNPTRVSARVYSKFGSPMQDYHYIAMWAGPPDFNGTFDVDDYAAGLIRFENRATLSFEAAWACNAEEESSLELLGTRGGIKAGGGKIILRTEMDNRIADVELFYDKGKPHFQIQLEKFAAAVRGEGKVPATGEEGLVMMRLLDAIYRSSEVNAEVEL